MRESPLRILQVGMTGYAERYLERMLEWPADGGMRLTAVVDFHPERCSFYDRICERGISVFRSVEAFRSEQRADLAILVVGTHLHAPLTIEMLAAGSHVLCEKPLAATCDQGLAIVDASEKTGKIAAIGYQWSFSSAVQRLKKDIIEGRLGRPLRLKSLASWPRAESYYTRSNWKGRETLDDGTPVYDGPANGACAHHLHNMFFLLGERLSASASPVHVQAERYRAKPIETDDTICLRAWTKEGAEILFYATHSAETRVGPDCEFEFEEGVVRYNQNDDPRFVFCANDGKVIDYGDPNKDPFRKIEDTGAALRGAAPMPCDAQTALAQCLCQSAAHWSAPQAAPFPRSMIRSKAQGEDTLVHAPGLLEALTECFAANALPSEAGEKHSSWSRPGRPVEVGKSRSGSLPL